jgi:serine/threonine-protein kinase
VSEERRNRAKEILRSALARKPEERRRFLVEACRDDPSLLPEVEALFQSYERLQSGIEQEADSPLGRKIGKYEVLERVGQGAMGVVYKARDVITKRLVALKVMARHLTNSDEARRRFSREATLTMRLNHPNIVRTLARGQHEGHAYIAFEYLEGETVRARIKRLGALPWPEAVRIVRLIADALADVHAHKIIHRDVKCANIILVGGDDTPKLTDFGLAYGTDLSVMTDAGHWVGTMAYMAPEQVAGEAASPTWDLYGLGAVFYEMLTGTLPFAGLEPFAMMRAIAYDPVPPPSSLGIGLPSALETMVMRMLAKKVDERYPSARAVAEVLSTLRFD